MQRLRAKQIEDWYVRAAMASRRAFFVVTFGIQPKHALVVPLLRGRASPILVRGKRGKAMIFVLDSVTFNQQVGPKSSQSSRCGVP